MNKLLPVSEARERILAHFKPVSTTSVPLVEACGRVLSQEIAANTDLPPFTNSSVDGFALRSDDISSACDHHAVVLRVVGDIPAGTTPQVTIRRGEAARIMTGAMLPQGADVVVPVENTDHNARQAGTPLPEHVSIFSAAKPGNGVRPKGQDLAAGTVVMHAGRRLRAEDVGLLASLGIVDIPVYRKPKVALFSTGDELISPAEPLIPGKIRDANTTFLAALIEQNGGEVFHLGTTPDNLDTIRRQLLSAVESGADLLLTSAGVSVGVYDYVRTVIEEQGELTFWRVNMRPGKPVAFGSIAGTPLIGLPGNPVSAFIGFQVFVQPVLQLLAGQRGTSRRKVRVILNHPIQSDGRESYLRMSLHDENGSTMASYSSHQGSGNLYSLVLADAIAIVPAGVESLPAGAELDAWLLDEF